MTQQSATATEDFQSRFQNNLCRALIILGRQVEINTISALRRKGHNELAMAYGSPMAILGNSSPRVTELAEMLGMSKQLCLQTLKPFEQADYIYREPDPDDGRAKRVRLSSQGRSMIKQGLKELDKLSLEYEKALGKRRLQQLSKIIGKISFSMSTQSDHLFADFRQNENPLPSFLVRTAQQIEKRIIAGLKNQEHLEISIAQSRVLLAMTAEKNRIQPIAKSNGISTQSVARAVRDLESSGYVVRKKDPDDHRNKLISLTAKGQSYLQAWIIKSEEIQQTYLQLDNPKSNPASADLTNKHSQQNALMLEAVSDLYNYFSDDRIDLNPATKLNSTTKANSQHLTKEELLLIVAIELEQLEVVKGARKPLTKKDNKHNFVFSKQALNSLGEFKLDQDRFSSILNRKAHETLKKALELSLN